MNFQIALNFEDGVTRFIEAGGHETVADAAYRQASTSRWTAAMAPAAPANVSPRQGGTTWVTISSKTP